MSINKVSRHDLYQLRMVDAFRQAMDTLTERELREENEKQSWWQMQDEEMERRGE